MEHFKKLGIGKELLEVIAELGFEKPSEIQKKTIPLVVAGKDVIGNSATGSGKTLAFFLNFFVTTLFSKVFPYRYFRNR